MHQRRAAKDAVNFVKVHVTIDVLIMHEYVRMQLPRPDVKNVSYYRMSGIIIRVFLSVRMKLSLTTLYYSNA